MTRSGAPSRTLVPVTRSPVQPRTIARLLAAVLAGFAIVEAVLIYQQITTNTGGWYIGMDYDFYRGVGARWLADGSYYWPHQLAGPYDVRLMVDVLYPPTALVLFVPLVFLPAVVWWLVPAGIIGYALYRWRPGPFAICGMLLLLMWPRAMGAIFHGNTDMWVAAGVAGALLWGWPAAIVALKPTFLPLALLGIRRRAWWVAAGLGVVSIIPMLGLWLDYVTAMRNLHIGWEYSLGSIPIAVLPLVGWLGRSHRERLGRVPDTQEVERG